MVYTPKLAGGGFKFCSKFNPIPGKNWHGSILTSILFQLGWWKAPIRLTCPPKKMPFQKESSLPTTIVQGTCQFSGEYNTQDTKLSFDGPKIAQLKNGVMSHFFLAWYSGNFFVCFRFFVCCAFEMVCFFVPICLLWLKEIPLPGKLRCWKGYQTRWWFKKLLIFTPKIWEHEPVFTHIFQMSWFKHQPAKTKPLVVINGSTGAPINGRKWIGAPLFHPEISGVISNPTSNWWLL